MKKFLSKIMFAAVAVLSVAGFTSCNNVDDDPNVPSQTIEIHTTTPSNNQEMTPAYGAILSENILDMFDLTALGFLLAQGIGRWGNFVNQEAYGSFTGSSFWGMTSNRTVLEMGEGLVHPCFLYESVWCIAGFFIINHLSKSRKFSGETALMYGVWYGFGRAIIELLRTDSLMIGRIKVSCMLSVLVCIVCAILLVVLRKRQNILDDNTEYENMITDNSEDDLNE